jgi:hypothetical protein
MGVINITTRASPQIDKYVLHTGPLFQVHSKLARVKYSLHLTSYYDIIAFRGKDIFKTNGVLRYGNSMGLQTLIIPLG